MHQQFIFIGSSFWVSRISGSLGRHCTSLLTLHRTSGRRVLARYAARLQDAWCLKFSSFSVLCHPQLSSPASSPLSLFFLFSYSHLVLPSPIGTSLKPRHHPPAPTKPAAKAINCATTTFPSCNLASKCVFYLRCNTSFCADKSCCTRTFCYEEVQGEKVC